MREKNKRSRVNLLFTINESTLVNHSKTSQTLQILVNVGQMVKQERQNWKLDRN